MLDGVLRRVGEAHAGFVSVLALVFGLAGHPVRGVLLGGALIGLSFATFWIAARAITDPARRKLAAVLGVIKVSLYLGLSAAVLSGRVVADADGFALGVSCFPLATLAVVLRSQGSPGLGRAARP
ncbi:MAG: hypothetical protein ABW298_02285 [Candidatus Binatia bacterium]|jgi:hypothetical protein